MADGGTIFLDEIGSVSPKMQIELLRVIETKQFNRVGGNEVIKSDFRIIIATNEPLEELVKTGRFRGRSLLQVECFYNNNSTVKGTAG